MNTDDCPKGQYCIQPLQTLHIFYNPYHLKVENMIMLFHHIRSILLCMYMCIQAQKTSWGDGGSKTKICHGTICQRYILAALQTIKLHLTKVRNKAKPLKYSEKKSCISYQITAHVHMYGHQPRYTSYNNGAQTDVYTRKCQVATWCLLLP
jgi:hypothetical protein